MLLLRWALLSVATLPCLATAQDKPVDKPVTREQCDAWVKQLVNRQAWPYKEPYVLNSPRNSGDAAYQDVKAAYDLLAKNVVLALPSLVEGVGDKRYSYWQESTSGAYVPRSVGEACRELITFQVEVYRDDLYLLDDTGVPRTLHFIRNNGGHKKWYESRKDKPLYDLQLEALDWALLQPADERVDSRKWKQGLAKLRKFREEFVKAGKPHHRVQELWFEGK